MLNGNENTNVDGQKWTAASRRASVLALLVLTVGVAGWKAPAGAQEFKRNQGNIERAKINVDQTKIQLHAVEPFDVRFIPETMKGVFAFRPAATAKLAGMSGLTAWLRDLYAEDFAELAKQLGVDTGRAGFRKLACEEIESLVVGLNFDKMEGVQVVAEPGKPKEAPTHQLMFSGFTARAVAPFDWLAFLRQWKLECEEVRIGSRSYFRVKVPGDSLGHFTMACFLPDDRTLVMDDERWIKQVATREVQQAPSFLQGADWDRVSRGIVAAVIDNHGDRTSNEYKIARPDDAMVLATFRGVERWTIGAAESDEITLTAEATTRDPRDAAAVAKTIENLKTMGLAALELVKNSNPTPLDDKTRTIGRRIATGLLSGLKPETAGSSVALRIEGAGTVAEVLPIIKSFYSIEAAQARAEGLKAVEAKAASKTEKR